MWNLTIFLNCSNVNCCISKCFWEECNSRYGNLTTSNFNPKSNRMSQKYLTYQKYLTHPRLHVPLPVFSSSSSVIKFSQISMFCVEINNIFHPCVTLIRENKYIFKYMKTFTMMDKVSIWCIKEFSYNCKVNTLSTPFWSFDFDLFSPLLTFQDNIQ